MTRFLFLALSILLTLGCSDERRPARDGGGGDAGSLDSGTDSAVDALPDTNAPDSPQVRADLIIWACSGDTLYEFSPVTNVVREIGMFNNPRTGRSIDNMFDLAVNSAEELYGVADGSIWRIDPDDASVSEVTSLGEDFFANSLTFVPAGLVGSGEALIAAAGSEFVEVNLSTGAVTPVTQMRGYVTSGDIVANLRWGRRILASVNPEGNTGVNDLLVWVDIDTGATEELGPSTGFNGIYGLGYWDGIIFGFTSEGELIGIREENSAGYLIEANTGAETFFGAGVSTITDLI